MTADLAAKVLIYLAAAPAITYALMYGLTAPWWRSSGGRALFTSALGMALLTGISALYQTFGDDYPGRNIVRLTVYAIIVTGLWLKVGAYVHERRVAARQGNLDRAA